MSRFCSFAFGVLILLAGCTRSDDSPYGTEKDDPSYQHGKSLEQQGRDQEALGAFLKIIAKRGEDAPESHLEAGLLYQEHVKDPITAIYYYKKYLELCPNSAQAGLVRGRIAACMRDFARTLPGQPLGVDAMQPDLSDVVDRLQKENEALKSQLAALRANRPAPADEPAGIGPLPARSTPDAAADTPRSVVTRAPLTPERLVVAPAHAPGARSGMTLSPTATNHAHTVEKGDTLMSISQRYYGTRSKWRDIYAANRDVMKSENDLKIGMPLKIP